MPRRDGTGPFIRGMQRSMCGRRRCRFACRRRQCEVFFDQSCPDFPCLRENVTAEQEIAVLEEQKKRLEDEIALLKKGSEEQDG